MVAKEPVIVVVTGASGFVGLELAHQLLTQGYTVRAVTQDASEFEMLQPLGAALAGKLELTALDMREEGAFDQVVQGATYVFHCAAAVTFGSDNVAENEEKIVNTNVNGAANLIKALAHCKGLKRLVMTSSICAIRNPNEDGSKVLDDKDWSDTCTVDEFPYHVSKRNSERKARELANEFGIDIVTIHPAMVVGPILSAAKGGFSINSVKEVLEGKPIQEAVLDCIHSDVRDVARAHILAAEVPTASGRYIVSHTHRTNWKKIAQLLKTTYPDYPVKEDNDENTIHIFDTSKLKELGMQTLIPVEQSFLDQARTTVALQMISL